MPAGAAVVLEAGLVSAEERSRLAKANLTHGVFQVGVNLNLLCKLGCFNLHKCCAHSLQVTALIIESDTSRAYWVLVLVRVDASIHDSSKEIIHDAGQRLSIQHAVQRANKHSLTRVQTLSRATDVVAVRDHPGYHLHILASHSAAGHLEVVLSVVLRVKRVLGAGVEQSPDRLLILKHQVNVAYRQTAKHFKRGLLAASFCRADDTTGATVHVAS